MQDHFLWLLVASYALATFWPQWGLALKQLRFADIGNTGVELTFISILLSWLLFSAGLGLSLDEVRAVAARPTLLIAGLGGNVVVPLAFLGALAALVFPWLDVDRRQILLTGLAIVAAVPIASSSTAWCQNANGNLALSIGLVLFSTILSPFTTPFVLQLANWLGPEEPAGVVRQLSSTYVVNFLLLFVLLPLSAGIAVRRGVGRDRIGRLQATLKSINLGCLLLLNYSNASLSLPQVVVGSDDQFLVLVVLVTGLMCGAAFASAWLIARALRAGSSQRTALLFGMGMNNNGVGLVLASLALAADTRVLLPIIVYNLWQHLIAGAVDHWLCRNDLISARAPTTPE